VDGKESLELLVLARQVEAREFRLRLLGNTLIAMKKLLEGGIVEKGQKGNTPSLGVQAEGRVDYPAR